MRRPEVAFGGSAVCPWQLLVCDCGRLGVIGRNGNKRGGGESGKGIEKDNLKDWIFAATQWMRRRNRWKIWSKKENERTNELVPNIKKKKKTPKNSKRSDNTFRCKIPKIVLVMSLEYTPVKHKHTVIDLFNVCSNHEPLHYQNNLQFMILTYLWPWSRSSKPVRIARPEPGYNDAKFERPHLNSAPPVNHPASHPHRKPWSISRVLVVHPPNLCSESTDHRSYTQLSIHPVNHDETTEY